MNIRIIILFFSSYLLICNISSQEYSALDLYKNCKNYKDWIESNFEEPINSQVLFNMGKCQGIMETTGKIMLTLCKERQRNVNINKNLSANLDGIRTISLVKEYVMRAPSFDSLQNYNAQELLALILSQKWPCR